MTTRGSVRRWWSLAAVVALLVGACGGATAPTDPTDALVDAVERSFSDSFTFDVQVQMDDAARAEMPPGGLPFGALLDSLEITGHASGDHALQLTVAAMGQEVFELRRTDATHTYLRTDAGRIAETFGLPFERDELMTELEQEPEDVREMWTGLLDGRWVGVVGEPSRGPEGQAMLPGGVDPSEMEALQQEVFGGSPAGFARRFASASFADSDGGDGRVLDVRLHTRAMAEAVYTTMLAVYGDEHADDEQVRRELERVPETVGGITVEVSDRLVDRLTVDVFELARSLDAAAGERPRGSLRLVADIGEHGTAGPVAAPDGALEVPAEDLGHHHPGAFLPGLGSGTMWPLMAFLVPTGMSSSVGGIESSIEVTGPQEAPAVELTAAPGEPPPPGATPLARPPMSLETSPHAGPAGTQVTITVAGFEGGPVEVRWDDRDGPVLATADGPDFTVEVTVPTDASPGRHTFFLRATAPDATRVAGIGFEVTD